MVHIIIFQFANTKIQDCFFMGRKARHSKVKDRNNSGNAALPLKKIYQSINFIK